ncbi:hypothetical protein SRS16CHR_02737 [Variovorax sp. SRS16]|uniref:DUF3443 domain-containing protein n=1 Tax=Variovorax sp. SRS16 TaxID=282217 RepID=UPI001316CBCB|nr:DUF3443 domain-containing protein [Variovorax sp. SRS16]VTU20910.1 hypothetical protein SRS16CHR_02737 [Variovorax sp. SRS16]
MKTFADRIGLRRLRAALAAGLCVLATGCGGGGGGGGGALPVLPAITGTTTAAGTTTSGSTTASTSGSNVAAISVDVGPAGTASTVNFPFVSVRVCAPGSTTVCQTIDHVILDTGSSGLRLLASALNIRTGLTPQIDGSSAPYGECVQFVSSYAWGSVRLADVSLAGETAPSVPVQIIGDPDFGVVPSSCSTSGAQADTVASFGGNGLLGVSVFRQDCGSACVGNAIPGTYYVCPSAGSCTSSTITLARQVANPVALLASDNNGVLIQLPAIAAAGAKAVAGSLVLGIGTRSNNALGNAQIYGLDRFGNFSTTFNGHAYAQSFIDSGSNFFFFDSSTLPGCTNAGEAGLYCPTAAQSLSALNQGTNGTNGTVNFSIGNAQALLAGNPTATAFDNIGGNIPGIDGFDWGLSFFFGRNVFTALEGASTAGGTGPYVAY